MLMKHRRKNNLLFNTKFYNYSWY